MNHGRLVLSAVALGATAMLPFAASAQDSGAKSGFYLGGGIGYDRINNQDFPGPNDNFTDHRTTYKGIAGFQLNPILGIEGQYVDFATSHDTNEDEVKAHGWTADMVAAIPLFDHFQPYAKAGALFWNADGHFGTDNANDSGTDFTYGVGGRFEFNDFVQMRLEYERFKLNNTDVDMPSANLVFTF